MQQIPTTASYVSYAGLLVSLAAHYGFILSSNDAIALIGGVVALCSVIYQHFGIKKANVVIASGVKS